MTLVVDQQIDIIFGEALAFITKKFMEERSRVHSAEGQDSHTSGEESSFCLQASVISL